MHCEVLASHVCPGPQQAVQPHNVVPDGHNAAHAPSTHTWPHAHGGLHAFATHCLLPNSVTCWQLCPDGHDVHVPPQPSD